MGASSRLGNNSRPRVTAALQRRIMPPKNMISSATLTGSHLRTYNTIFQHPISHNLEWRAVRALLGKLGHLAEEPNGNLKVTRNGQVLVLHPPRTKDVDETGELMALRHFLERSETATPDAEAKAADWLLLINHHEALIFRTDVDGGAPQRIQPPGAEGETDPASKVKDFSRGREKTDPTRFFAPVAKALAAAGPILVFGSGTGMSSEMDRFVAWAKDRHPEVAARIIGSLVVDAHHLTQEQLLAKAREFIAKARGPKNGGTVPRR